MANGGTLTAGQDEEGGCAAVSDQHGEAKSEDEDPDRPLTDRGVTDVRRVLAWPPERAAWCSSGSFTRGKTRARHTAAAWGEALGVPIDEADGLAPRDDPAIWAARVAAETRDMMLVGHLPHLARLAGLLLAGDPDRPLIAFRQGGLVGLEEGPAGWSVSLVLSPAAV